MNERSEPDSPSDTSDVTRNEAAESDPGAGDDDTEESSGPLARARSIGTEAVGVVVDAVIDAL